MISEARVLADAISANCASQLPNRSRLEVEHALEAFRNQSTVMLAVIRDNNGNLVASYFRDSVKESHGAITTQPAVTRPVMINGQKLGQLEIVMDLSDLNARLRKRAMTIFGTTALSLLLGFLVVTRLQRYIVIPLQHLVKTAEKVSLTKDFSIRARRFSDDEIGVLTDTFNNMLAQIQEGDIRLKDAQENLEKRVRDRTAELERQIEENKRAVRALGESEQKLSLFLQQTPLGAIELDLEGRVVFWNPAAQDIFEYRPMEATGHILSQLIASECPSVRGTLFWDDLLNGDESIHGISSHCTKYGQPLICEWHSAPLFDLDHHKFGMVVLVQNVTERIHSEEQIARMAAIVESSSDAIIGTDSTGRIISWNPGAERMFGYTSAEMIGDLVDRLIPDERLHEWYQLSASTRASLHVRGGRETIWGDRNGNAVLLSLTVSPIESGSDENTGLAIIARDVSENRRLQEFADRAQRLETAGRIAGQVAHDFNNLLGPLVAYPQFIREELPSDHPAQELLGIMEKAAEQIADINQQLLTLGRRGHYTQEPLCINDVVKQALKQMGPLSNGVRTVLNLEPNLMNVRGGASQLMRIILNLVHNSSDAMPKGGTITIRSENFYVDSPFGQIIDIPHGEYIKLTIADTGSGIAPEILPRIFDPFFTTKQTDRRRGSGLGLSVVHAVVKDHEGYIDCDSKVGIGTTTYIYLPITREATTTEQVSNCVGGNETILVVDDDHTQLDVTARLLNSLGYKVETVQSGEDGLQRVKETEFDLVLLDMIMPDGINGAETLDRMQAIQPNIKAIIVSGYAESESVQRALKLGALSFLRKPLTMNRLANEVRLRLDTPSKKSEKETNVGVC